MEKTFHQKLELHVGGPVEDLIQKQLLAPLEDLLARPSKKIRGPLVEFGYRLATDNIDPIISTQKDVFDTLSLVVEHFHAASLTIDDIQDNSPTRRGAPSLHSKYGVNVALNAGNWLYFWPFEMIKKMNLPLPVESALHHACYQTLLRAHYGQAIDVGIAIDQIPQSRIPEVCLSSLELKSGALMSLPMELGAILGGLGEERMKALKRFGHHFGTALQMFNDIGNFWGHKEPEKKMEDLKHRRPSWIWGSFAKNLNPVEFAEFQRLVSELPNEANLLRWIKDHGYLIQSKEQALSFMEDSFDELENSFSTINAHTKIIPQLKELGTKIARSYE